MSSCKELQAEKPNLPRRDISASRSTVTGTGGEVGVATSVSIRLLDNRGKAVQKIRPVVAVVDGSGTVVSGTSSSGCSESDVHGDAGCSVTSTVPGSYYLKVTSPATFTSSSTATFVQITRSLSFSTQPSTSATAGTAFTTQPVVQLLDRVGNLNTSGTDTVTLALTSAGSANLLGTTAVAAVAGVATFAGLSIDLASSYTLQATSGSATAATSGTITVAPGAATQLAFTTQPSASTAANTAFAQQPVVTIQDALGNTVTSSTCQVSLSLTTKPTVTDNLNGTLTTKPAVAGVVDFLGQNLRISTYTGGTGYVITATGLGACAGFTDVSDPFDITLAGVPSQLLLTSTPSDSSMNETWLAQPVIQILDVNGDRVTTDNDTIVTVTTGAGGAANLTGATSLQAVNGEVTFTDLSYTSGDPTDAGTYTLNFDATNPSGVTFTTVTHDIDIDANGMTGTALQFVTSLSSVAINEVVPSFQVKIVDAGGHLCTLCSDIITLGFYFGSGSLDDNGGGYTRAAVNGIATFDGFSLSTSGMKQFSVSATLNAVPVTAYSNTFSIKSFGTRSKLAFGTQPASGGSTDLVAWATQPKVRVEDSAGNLVSSDNGTPITLACVNPSSGCTLLGTLTAYTVNGIATFTNLRTAETALTNVVLEASSSVTTDPVTTTQSNSFSGNLGTSYALEFLTQPVGGADPWATQPRVRILDNQGHFVSTATDNVTLTCVSASSTCTLNGTVTVAAVSGVATFAGLSTNEAALTNVVIEASSGALVRAQSNSFTGKP